MVERMAAGRGDSKSVIGAQEKIAEHLTNALIVIACIAVCAVTILVIL